MIIFDYSSCEVVKNIPEHPTNYKRIVVRGSVVTFINNLVMVVTFVVN